MLTYDRPMQGGATRSDRDGDVPAPAAALVGLLNSRAYAGMADKLDSPESAALVLRPFGQEDGSPTVQRLDLVRAVRDDCWAWSTSAILPTPPGIGQRSRIGSARERSGRTSPRTAGSICDRSPAILWSGGSPATSRRSSPPAAGPWLRLCASDVCREAFYDTTRSRTRRWHSYEVCGNRSNGPVRARSDSGLPIQRAAARRCPRRSSTRSCGSAPPFPSAAR